MMPSRGPCIRGFALKTARWRTKFPWTGRRLCSMYDSVRTKLTKSDPLDKGSQEAYSCVGCLMSLGDISPSMASHSICYGLLVVVISWNLPSHSHLFLLVMSQCWWSIQCTMFALCYPVALPPPFESQAILVHHVDSIRGNLSKR
jgi:hypothetical protein